MKAIAVVAAGLAVGMFAGRCVAAFVTIYRDGGLTVTTGMPRAAPRMRHSGPGAASDVSNQGPTRLRASEAASTTEPRRTP